MRNIQKKETMKLDKKSHTAATTTVIPPYVSTPLLSCKNSDSSIQISANKTIMFGNRIQGEYCFYGNVVMMDCVKWC